MDEKICRLGQDGYTCNLEIQLEELRTDNAKLNTILFHRENGLSHPDLQVEIDKSKFAEMQTELDKANDIIEFWQGEDDGEKWPPENIEWRKLVSISKESRTSEQKQRILDLTKIIWFKCDYKLQYERAEQLQADNDKHKEFARSVIQIECWGSYEPDGLGTQDLAEKLGLVKSSIATEEDINDESDFEAGDRIYKFADILKEKP